MPIKDLDERAEYNRMWCANHREEINAYKRAWVKANWPRIAERYIASQRSVPLAMKAARGRVDKALKRGEIVRPDTCSQCGGAGFIEAAHENYHERLAIRWLCRPCHRRWDMKHPKTKDAQWVRPLATHCRHGHSYTEENTYWHRGHRQCRICRAAANDQWKARRA